MSDVIHIVRCWARGGENRDKDKDIDSVIGERGHQGTVELF